jgi:hypothetical protein
MISLLALGSGCDSVLGLGDFVAAETTTTSGPGGDPTVGSSSSGAGGTSASSGDVGGGGSGTGAAPSQGGSGPGGAGGAGGSEPCEEGAACYDGPDGTDGVGRCLAGTITCDEDGVATCDGQVLPAAEEDCGVVGDEDCNGESDVEDSGATCVCVPGSSADCYTGEEGTLGRGVCVGGRAACDSDGLGLGTCEGEVTPTEETCALPGDEDCDGETNEAGVGCSCTPDTTQACYSGPSATRGVGACRDGSQTCAGDGTGYGPCNGEQTPAAENCNATGDENCDGIPCSEVQWAAQYGGSGDQEVLGIAAGANGDLIVTGRFEGSLPFGAPPLIAAGSQDVFVARFSPTGQHLWSLQAGDAEFQTPTGLAVAPNGDIIVGGYFNGTMTVGGTSVTAPGGTDPFLLRLTANGDLVWLRRFVAGEDAHVRAVAVDGSGNPVVFGDCQVSINLGGGAVDCGSQSMFLAKLPPSGATPTWVKTFGGATASEVALDSAGNIAIAGRFSGTINFGGGTLTGTGDSSSDFFVARFDPGGLHSWSLKGTDEASVGTVTGLRFGSTGNVYLAGQVGSSFVATSTASFGSGSLTIQKVDGFLAMYGANGAPLRSLRFGGAENDSVTGLTVLANDDAVLVGKMGTSASWGGDSIGGASYGVVGRYDAAFSHLWTRAFANAFPTTGGEGSVADESATSLLIGFTAGGAMDFGFGAMVAGGGRDVVIARIYR